MNATEYDGKMRSLLSDPSTYKILPKDPTESLQPKMNSKLLDLKKSNTLPTKVYNEVRCSSGSVPFIYGLPKVHKDGVPLYPIVSFYTSPTYQLSELLTCLLSPLLGQSEYTVHSSREFVSFTQGIKLDPDDALFSFDVVSLLTRVPVNLALEIARQRLEADEMLSDRTCLSTDNITSPLSFCLGATYFSYQGSVYQQIYGMAMGSPVSVVTANLVMEHVETSALSTFPHKSYFGSGMWMMFAAQSTPTLLTLSYNI